MKMDHLSRNGFTLIELLVTIVILSILMGLIVGISGLATRKSSEAKAQADLQTLASALEEYRLAYGIYPAAGNTNALDLLKKEETRIPEDLKAKLSLMDPWERAYIYSNSTKYAFILYSQGARVDLRDDDITVSTMQ